jgi:hypothetical protein
MSPDPFGRAIHDQHRGDRSEPLLQRDGGDVREHPIERFYFADVSADGEYGTWLRNRLEGPLVDMGAGAGKHSLHFQTQFETVAIDVSEYLIETMRDRGVNDARHIDMFSLRENFPRDRFQSALAHGTQLGLAGSMDGLRRFLGDLAFVTTPDATAVLDCYDPGVEGTTTLLGYRPDPTPGLAYRVMHFEYESDVGETLLFRLFSPDRVQEATIGTAWVIEEVTRKSGDDSFHYRVALSKTRSG